MKMVRKSSPLQAFALFSMAASLEPCQQKDPLPPGLENTTTEHGFPPHSPSPLSKPANPETLCLRGEGLGGGRGLPSLAAGVMVWGRDGA